MKKLPKFPGTASPRCCDSGLRKHGTAIHRTSRQGEALQAVSSVGRHVMGFEAVYVTRFAFIVADEHHGNTCNCWESLNLRGIPKISRPLCLRCSFAGFSHQHMIRVVAPGSKRIHEGCLGGYDFKETACTASCPFFVAPNGNRPRFDYS